MFPDVERFQWFSGLTGKTIDKCKRTAFAVPGYSDSPVTVYVPGGDNKYPAFWIRDAVMQCRSGLIEISVMKTMLEIILFFQNGPECRSLENGLRVTPWAIPDHINLPGLGNSEFESKYSSGAVFFPGTYSSTENQGTGHYGLRPADDDIYEVVDLTKLIADRLPGNRKIELLQKKIKGKSILERLDLGMQSMIVEKNSGLCLNTPEDWSASNFHDALKPMGLVALTSCLRFRAAKTMSEFFRFTGNHQRTDDYQIMSELITDSILRHLFQKNGWIQAASRLNRQPDVWSTSMAVYYGLLTGNFALQACKAMLRAYKEGISVNYQGYLRHTLTAADAVPGKKTWEEEETDVSREKKYGVYQSGGYWPQPLGYYVCSLAQVDTDAAEKLAADYIDHTKKFEDEGAPFEWINPEIPLRETPALGRFYGPSAALPLEGFARLF